MVYILLCILMNVLIYVNFKIFPRFKVNTVHAIIFNYFFCTAGGLWLSGGLPDLSGSGIEWATIAAGLGVIFIVNFNLISLTTERYGISVASIATKLSLAIPVIVSLFLLNSQFKIFNFWNYAGIFLALPAMFLGSLKREGNHEPKTKGYWALLPLTTFLLSGTIDASINIANFFFLEPGNEPGFILTIFASAAILGAGYLVTKKKKIRSKNILAGLTLAVPNFLALFFLIRSLNAFNNDGSVVYPTVNTGVIIFASFLSWRLFKDRFTLLNKIGIALSALSIVLIYHQELLDYFTGK